MQFKQFFKRIFLFIFIVQSHGLLAIGENVPWAMLRRMLPHNPVIVEAGAQFGEDTSWMSEFWSQGTIHAFEPSPESFAELQKVANRRANVHVYPLALSNQKGDFSFFLAGGASSLLRPRDAFNRDYFHSDLEHPIVVQAVTLDEWAREHGVDKVDFLWFDMEGNELRALEGAMHTLKNVKVIYTEVNLQRFWEGCVMYEELKAWMATQGFIEIWSDIVPLWHGNALFLNTNL